MESCIQACFLSDRFGVFDKHVLLAIKIDNSTRMGEVNHHYINVNCVRPYLSVYTANVVALSNIFLVESSILRAVVLRVLSSDAVGNANRH